MEANSMEQAMKRLLFLVMLTGIAIAAVDAAAQTQSPALGDYARAVKKSKPASRKASKTYDNDNLPNNSKLSVVGATPTEAAAEKDNKDQNKDSTATKDADQKDDSSKKAENASEVKAGQSSEDRQKSIADWKQKIDDQKGKVDLLSRELDVLQRERQIKQADFNSSTARTIQNPRGFDEEDAKYKQQIADKQKILDDAKGNLNELQEQARKDGVPSRSAE
jgi:hypothetical protein